VTQDEVIPFLIAFQEIVESDVNHKTKITQLRELRKHPSHGPYWKRFSKSYQDFPYCFFYIPLTELPGVGQKTTKALYEAGFHTPNDIRAASLEELSHPKNARKKPGSPGFFFVLFASLLVAIAARQKLTSCTGAAIPARLLNAADRAVALALV
jgi:hypothetical protein